MPTHGGDRHESPTVVAARLGLRWQKDGKGSTLTWDQLLDEAVRTYWTRRAYGYIA